MYQDNPLKLIHIYKLEAITHNTWIRADAAWSLRMGARGEGEGLEGMGLDIVTCTCCTATE